MAVRGSEAVDTAAVAGMAEVGVDMEVVEAAVTDRAALAAEGLVTVVAAGLATAAAVEGMVAVEDMVAVAVEDTVAAAVEDTVAVEAGDMVVEAGAVRDSAEGDLPLDLGAAAAVAVALVMAQVVDRKE